ncbi:hypothetical protein Tco_1062973 [Tanacetum coccineum]
MFVDKIEWTCFVHEVLGLESLGVEIKKGNYSKCQEKGCYFEKCLPLVSLRHQQINEKKICDERLRRRKWNAALFDAGVFTDFAFLFKNKRTHDSFDNFILTIVEIEVPLHNLSKQASQEHTVGNKKSIGHFQVVIVLARSLLYD